MRTSRQSLGLTRRELAQLIDESEGVLGHWERGEHEPQSRRVIKVARALGVSTDYLFDLTDEPAAPARRAS